MRKTCTTFSIFLLFIVFCFQVLESNGQSTSRKVAYYDICPALSINGSNKSSSELKSLSTNIFEKKSPAYIFLNDSLPPPRNLDGYTQDVAVRLWWEVPLLPDTTKSFPGSDHHGDPDQISAYNKKIRTVNVSEYRIRDTWDLQMVFPCGDGSGEAGIESDGNYVYTTKWNSGNGTFFQYEMDGTFNGPFTVPGCQDVRDLAYNDVDGLFYGSNAGTSVWGMNFTDMTVDNTISAPTACRAIAYDNAEVGFWANNWDTDITLFNMSGAFVSSFPVVGLGSFYGFAYDQWTDSSNPYLWGFSQDASGAELVQMDLNAGGAQIFNMPVGPIVGGAEISGGLYTHCGAYEDNRVTIGGIRQNDVIFALELTSCTGGGGGYYVPDNLLGYNLYRNDDFLDYIEYDGNDTTFHWDFLTPYPPGMFCYTVTALYDLTPQGMPGDTGESVHEGPICFWCGIEFILPFVEDWNAGSFDPNLWTADSNWFINGQFGNPEPTAQFTGSIIDTNYHSSLISYWINCKYHPGTQDIYIDGDFWLEFDLKLDDNSMSGNEFLTVQLTDSIEWQTITEFSNEGGSFDWQFYKINITDLAKGNYIRIGFVAEGQNATDINSWYIDNIMVYRQCNPPLDLQWLVFDESMAWSPPLPHTSDHSDISRELLGYNVYEISQFLEFTTDTFYVLEQSYGYGPYYVTAVYEDCETASNPIYGPTEIDENITITDIKIFPNPAKDRISIRSDKVISRIQLIKSDGVLILDRNFQNSLVSLPLDNYPSGIYLVKIYQDNTVISRKLLLEK